MIGDFNHWNGGGHPMRSLGSSGVWELFIPGVGAGTRYKFEILGVDGVWRSKADPMARRTEVPPLTASVVDETVLLLERRGVDGLPPDPGRAQGADVRPTRCTWAPGARGCPTSNWPTSSPRT